MRRTTRELLLEDMEKGYVIPADMDNKLLKKRLYARRFCGKLFKQQENYKDALDVLEYKQLYYEAMENRTLFWVIKDVYEMAFYKGYQRAIDELKKGAEDYDNQ